MKFLNLLISFMLIIGPVQAQTVAPEKIQKDVLQLGKAGSGLDKELVFDTGDGASNKKLKIENSTKKAILNTHLDLDSLKSGGKLYLGNSGAYITWDNITQKLVYSNDGTLEKKIGSGSGSGAGMGENILENPSFEDLLSGWNTDIYGGILTRGPYLSRGENDEYYASFEGYDTYYFETNWISVPSYFKEDCSFTFDQSSLVDFKATIYRNNLLNIVTEIDIDASPDEWVSVKKFYFPCEPNSELKVRFTNKAYGTNRIDRVFLGSDGSSIKVYGDAPVGTIQESLLTEAQFQAEAGHDWILADGRNVAGSRFAEIFGSNIVPDLRGVFLRGKNNGSGKDAERDLGNYQEDAFQGHRHDVSFINGVGFAGGANTNPLVAFPNSGTASTGNPRTDTVNGTPRTANETRPKNVTVNFFIKINGKGIQAVSDVGYALRAGQIITGAFQSCPVNTLEADGSEYSKLKYPHLWSAIGTTHGTGVDANHGKLPDYRGRFLRGVDGTAGNDPDKASRTAMNVGGNTGNLVGSVQGDAIRNITGSVGASRRGTSSASGAFTSSANGNGQPINEANGNIAIGFDASRVVPVGGDNRPKNAYVKYCIQTVNTDITGTFRQIDELEERLRESGSIVSKRIKSGSTWIIIFSDGWVELLGEIAVNTKDVVFPIAMRDTNYIPIVGIIHTSTPSDYNSAILRSSISTTGFSTPTAYSGMSFTWRVAGYGASSVLATHGVYVDY